MIRDFNAKALGRRLQNSAEIKFIPISVTIAVTTLTVH
jgi:hypothetical protein